MLRDLIKLARPKQWIKGAFVLLGPLYAASEGKAVDWVGVGAALVAFSLAASGCYVLNDVRDVELDRAHPRKRLRPIATGAVPVAAAVRYGILLLIAAGAAIGGYAIAASFGAIDATGSPAWLALMVGMYIANVNAYSLVLKRATVLDVISLALGFVLRVLAGCIAAGVVASPWLVNTTFFISMFLAFAKRLGERRTMLAAEGGAVAARTVQAKYTDEILRMLVVVTGVASLLTYAGYVQAHVPASATEAAAGNFWLRGTFQTLWLTMLPATYGLLRCIVLVERGEYDDPTELAGQDRPFQVSVLAFGALTAAAWLIDRAGKG